MIINFQFSKKKKLTTANKAKQFLFSYMTLCLVKERKKDRTRDNYNWYNWMIFSFSCRGIHPPSFSYKAKFKRNIFKRTFVFGFWTRSTKKMIYFQSDNTVTLDSKYARLTEKYRFLSKKIENIFLPFFCFCFQIGSLMMIMMITDHWWMFTLIDKHWTFDSKKKNKLVKNQAKHLIENLSKKWSMMMIANRTERSL